MALTDTLQRSFLGQLGSTAPGMGASGTRNLGQLSQYFSTLLGGDRSALARSVAPATNAALEQTDAAKRELAEKGGGRTGGTAAASARIEDEKRKALDTLINQKQSEAAQGLFGVSQAELQTMLDSLKTGLGAAQSDINSRRAATAQMWSALIGGAAKAGSAFL